MEQVHVEHRKAEDSVRTRSCVEKRTLLEGKVGSYKHIGSCVAGRRPRSQRKPNGLPFSPSTVLTRKLARDDERTVRELGWESDGFALILKRDTFLHGAIEEGAYICHVSVYLCEEVLAHRISVEIPTNGLRDEEVEEGHDGDTAD